MQHLQQGALHVAALAGSLDQMPGPSLLPPAPAQEFCVKELLHSVMFGATCRDVVSANKCQQLRLAKLEAEASWPVPASHRCRSCIRAAL